MDVNDIEVRINKVISRHLKVSLDKVVPGASFVEDLGADSLDVVELLMSLESEFGITIPDDESDEVHSVRELVSVFKRHC
jgi:acyl carrier protein